MSRWSFQRDVSTARQSEPALATRHKSSCQGQVQHGFAMNRANSAMTATRPVCRCRFQKRRTDCGNDERVRPLTEPQITDLFVQNNFCKGSNRHYGLSCNK